jgi:hypothetical protein
MPDSSALLADLLQRLAVDDAVVAGVDVPAELEAALKSIS